MAALDPPQHRAPCSSDVSDRESFRVWPTDTGACIDTPSVYTRTYWTREQLATLRDALDAVLTEGAPR